MRQPKQVLSVPFKIIDGEPHFAIFKRADFKIWQFISGGVEENEKLTDAVVREVEEETGLKIKNPFQLKSKTTIPAEFVGGYNWGEEVVVIPEYAFCFEINGSIKIGKEHIRYELAKFDDAIKLLKYDSNKTALWETNHRIKNKMWR